MPRYTVSAALLDSDLTLARGSVSNLSESGAFLVTNDRVDRGRTVQLHLSHKRSHLLDMPARVVWNADGMDPMTGLVGSLQGVTFTEISGPQQGSLRYLLHSPGFLSLSTPALPPRPSVEDELGGPLTDPEIDRLLCNISPPDLDVHQGEIEEIRQELQPYLEKLVAKVLGEEDKTRDPEFRIITVLDYLEKKIPKYPFDPFLDKVFVEELLADFPELNVLEEVKTFRWHFDNDPVSRFENVRAALRRWLARSPQKRR